MIYNYEEIREKLVTEIKEIPDDKGKPLKTEVYKAEDLYQNPNHPECPDLTVYFDELRWASNPDFGIPGLYSWQTAVGADSAGHSKQGCFVMAGKNIPKKGRHISRPQKFQLSHPVFNLTAQLT